MAALEGPQWSVQEAENGREALKRIQESKPDVILLDLMMPEMDGFAVVRVRSGASRTRPIARRSRVLNIMGAQPLLAAMRA